MDDRPSIVVPDPPQERPAVVPPGHVWCSPMKRLYTRSEFDKVRASLAAFNRTLPSVLQELRVAEMGGQYGWSMFDGGTPKRAWRSSKYIAMLFHEEPSNAWRLTVCRAKLTDDGQFEDGLTWDELMWVKVEAGYGDTWAVELFPPAGDVVNVSNMRHLWLLSKRPAFAW